MGLSASQARLLNLTRRMHDIEYKAQNLEAQKLQMANDSKAVYHEYENALNKQKIQFKQIGADGSANYVDASLSTLLAAGYKLNILVNNAWIEDISKATSCNTDGTTGEITGWKDDVNETVKKLKLTDTATLRNLIEAGFITFQKPMSDGSFQEVNIATDTNLQEVTDDIELKKAEAKYEADMRKIDAKDKKFDTDLAALEAERNAIKTEMETLKTVARDNVDRTFKLFS